MVQGKLTEWGIWASHDSCRLGYRSPMEAVMKGHVEQSSNRIEPNITDEEASIVDNAVSELKQFNVVLWRVLCYKYVSNWGLRRISREYLSVLEYGVDSGKLVPHSAVSQLLARAEGFVEAVIHQQTHKNRLTCNPASGIN